MVLIEMEVSRYLVADHISNLETPEEQYVSIDDPYPPIPSHL
jgi:hypothetical protein